MSDSIQPIDSADSDLSPAQQQQPGSLLRLRDVQALNRSFRRLAEVQEVLLDRLEDLEEQKAQQSRFNTPLLGFGGMVLGVGLTVVAFMYMQPAQEIVLQQPSTAPINIEPAEIIVQAPDNTELNQNFEKLSQSLSQVIDSQNSDRQQMANLTSQILSSESQNDALRQAMADMQEQHLRELEEAQQRQQPKTMSELQTPPAATPAVMPAQASELVIRLNAMLAADGYSKTQFQTAQHVEGSSELHEVVVLSWNESGDLASMIKAQSVQLELHKMSHTVVMSFVNGSRTIGGAATVAIPSEGVRLEFSDITIDAWIEAFPELLPKTELAASSNGRSAEEVRVALDSLISKRGSFSYYKLTALGEINNNEMRYVQINWHDNSGRLVKTIEADSLIVILHKSGSVELQMHNGAFLSGSQRSPFSSDRFSLHLPRQNMQLWHDSIVPTRPSSF
ncbi:MAG: hypothetical protein H8E25_12250 [Planctomycetes bacterium]|nr:hypothetical protein [Planctomycetota bacterium]